MKYCTECGAEYQDSAVKCSDCKDSELVPQEEMRRRGIPLASDRDTRKFSRAGTAEDPLTQETLVRLLEEQDIPVFARPRSGGTVDPITGPAIGGWWEILVPEDHVEKAAKLIAEEKARLKDTEDEAARAAEEEATEGKA